MAQSSKESLKFIINHVVLPPKLPQEAEDPRVLRDAEQQLFQLLLSQVDSFRAKDSQHTVSPLAETSKLWDVIKTMLSRCAALNAAQFLSVNLLSDMLANLKEADVLLIQIKAQNAILILRRTSDKVMFECFEASPLSGAVIECEGSLLRTFPDHALSVALPTFDNAQFRSELAAKIGQLDAEVVNEMMPQSCKAGSSMAEIRDTAHPGLVSDMLMAILASLGQPVKAQKVCKRTRDDVLWKNCLLPWRRSPLWLAIRVTMQGTLLGALPIETATIQYKNFLLCLISRIALMALALGQPGEVCHVISVKIARRVYKLGVDTFGFVQDMALDACQRVQVEEGIQWESVQRVDANRATTTFISDFSRDTALSLDNSKTYLDAALAYAHSSSTPSLSFVPECQSLLGAHRGLPRLDTKVTNEELIFMLAECEQWIQQQLPVWMSKFDSTAPAAEDCTALADLAKTYWQNAERAYADSPEQLSIMLLTIAELWYTVDRLVARLIPLLLQYSPEIPIDLFCPLLLPKQQYMQRLHIIEEHIKNRHDRVAQRNPSIFSDPQNQSFAMFYYAMSDGHRDLRRQIEQKASTKKAAKQSEWQRGMQKYEQLKNEADRLDCEYYTAKYGIPKHRGTCKKCQRNGEARNMKITKYEWPLPPDESSCVAAIFELDCPASFVAWRNITWMLVHDIGRPDYVQGGSYADTLHGYSGLECYVQTRSSCVSLSSRTKSFEKTHYVQSFPLVFEDCYSNNALQYAMMDCEQHSWITDQQSQPSVQHKCVKQLPSGPYSNLQFAVDSTNHSQNQVIASQEICSPSLSLHEFTSFGSLRADGEKTQWLNIRRELAASNLSFNTEAVSTLFTQAAWQAGSRGDTVYRTSHLVLADQIFCQELLQNIQAILDSIEANWKSDYAMLLLINLVLRILSLTPNQDIVEIVLRLLRRMRSVTMKWTEALKTLLQDATDDAQVLKIQHRLLKAAMLCKMTFDVDTSYTLRMLHSTQDLNAWFFCCILVRDTVPGDMALLPTYIRGMYLQDLKLTHCIHIAARRLVIIDKNGGLDAALSKFWSGFQSASNSWQDSPEPNGRWLTTQTMATSGRVPQTIYFNVLDGELLVDGRPIGRLPREYLNSAIYRRIFKAQLLNVFSSDMQGMLYMTARKIYGYLVYFTIRDGKVAIIIRNDLQTLELVPHDTFEGDMPSAFVDDYVHWLDLSSHDIHFRPLLRPWDSDNTSWNLQYRPNTASTLCKGDTLLIDVRSATFTTTLDVFKSLETWKNTQMTLTAEGTLRVAFPRFDLHFFFNEQGHFQCHELCRIVDPDQSLGTMVGLRSRLILCGLGEYAGRFDRVLVIPQGIVSIRKSGAHVDVEVSSSSKKVRLFRYQIDATLRRLQGTSEVASTLYKAYLHALTTSLLPDPFTGNTGTEEALEILGQRSMRLTKPANEEILPLLTWISELTPRRKLYPKHLRVMQQVQWHPEMSSLAQHDDFVILAQQILDSGDQFLEFYPASKANKSLYAGRDTSLLARAKLRNASFRSSNFGGNVYGDRKDAQYNARDHISSTGRAARTFEVASLVRDWPRRFNVSGDLLRELKAMETISGFAGPFDSSRPLTELLKISFKASWAPLLELCRSCSEEHDKYRLLFLFSNMAYGQQISSISQLNTLLAFAFVPSLRAIGNPPPYDSFTLTKGIQLNYSEVRSTIEQHMESFTPSRTYVNATERVEDENAYEKKKKDQVSIVIDHYTYQWPCRIPSRPSAGQAGLLDIGRADFDIATLFAHWTRNGEFEAYINRAQGLLDVINEDRHVKTYTAADWQQSRSHIRIATSTALPSVPSLMSKVSPPLTLERNTMTTHINSERSKPNPRLQNLVNKIGTKCSNADQVSTRKQYSEELQASLAAFYEHNERISPSKLPCSLGEVVLDRDGWDRHVSDYSQNIFDALGPKDTASRAMEAGGLWPRLTMRSILSNLSTVSAPTFAIRWKDCLVAIGEAVTILQRARRIVLAGEREDVSSFCAELENVGRVGWEASQRPEWLLIEIENDLLIRPNQAQVALEMIEPSSSSNALMQLNMGEGKSSVIVPLVAVAIANGVRLSRVIVLKSLAKQMSDTLALRLGGLLDRPIYYMPFARTVDTTTQVVAKIQTLLEACKAQRGVLLAQPEHILSFKLMGIERLTAGESRISSQLLKTQKWLEDNARDLLDESDEILDVKFQLIYTLGTQRVMDGQPDRWLLTQSMFDLLEKHAAKLQATHPEHIEMKYRRDASFPTIRLLSETISETLMARVAADVVESHLPALSFEQCPLQVKTAASRFIQDVEVSDGDCDIIRSFYNGEASFLKNLLLVRGLISYKILLFVLRQKRWSVTYGLHPTRCLSAVPYRAKGVPAPSAEFGHPDVAIALTGLTYYYDGLTIAQIRQCFELLSKVDDPSLEYGAWIARCNNLPNYLRDWNAVNLEDDQRCHNELFPALRYGKKIADYFLANVVFPKEGKEFDEKLSTSGWDIPSKAGGAHLTTGFSGTNDNRFLLPLSITQQDLPNLKHTSGKVLDNVVREENLCYHCAKDSKGQQVSTKGLLQGITATEPNVRVLIDVGAQILDLSNKELIRMWLAIVPDVDAGIFFDKDDTVMVLNQNNKLETLATSSFQSRMDRCLVYLDEVHTRGTDLKFPTNARAAVTLGPRLTKDKLVQACMRLRKLGQGQSLMFVAPPEVDQSIKSVTGNRRVLIDGYDVLAWSLEQSCLSIERSQPLRVLQGLGHYLRQKKWDAFVARYPNFDDVAREIKATQPLIAEFMEKEEHELVDLYAPPALRTKKLPTMIDSCRNDPDPLVQELISIWRNTLSTICEAASMHDEHEREVAHEVELETQIQRPPRVKALDTSVSGPLRAFVRTGNPSLMMSFHDAYTQVAEKTSARSSGPVKLLRGLKTTSDFANTVERPQSGYYDSYLRSVNWILTSKAKMSPAELLVISQYELNQLYEAILSKTSKVRLHIYEPRVTKSMRSIDFAPPYQISPSVWDWRYVSSELRRELHLFAGQLYFNTYDEYRGLCTSLAAETNVNVEKLLTFIKAWTVIRRKGQDFLPTHVGQMVSNRTIKEEAFS